MNGEKTENTSSNRVVEIKKVIKNNVIATIHNNLLQARHKLSLEEIRLMDTIISFIQPEDDNLETYKIPVSVFQDLYGTQRKDIYEVVKRAIEGLLGKPIKLESINSKGKKIFEMFNFISYGRYEDGTGNFYVSIDSNFKPYLLKLKEFFTKIPIKYTYVLKSRYSIRLYEILKQYENTGFRIDYLHDLREILGVEKDEYNLFSDFEKRVLKPAVEEIYKKTDIEVEYIKKKTGRRVTQIEFIIKLKNIEDRNSITSVETFSHAQEQKHKEVLFDENEEKQIKDRITDIWDDIRIFRRENNDLLTEIKNKVNRLKENQVLFLIANINRALFPNDILKNMIISADQNNSLNNPMGFLIKTLQIDLENAKFKELIYTNEEVLKEKIEYVFKSGSLNKAYEFIKQYWNAVIRPEYQRKELTSQDMVLLKEPLKSAVYDEKENIILIPVPDDGYKVWLEEKIGGLKEFIKDEFNIDDVIVEILNNT